MKLLKLKSTLLNKRDVILNLIGHHFYYIPSVLYVTYVTVYGGESPLETCFILYITEKRDEVKEQLAQTLREIEEM